MVAKKKKFPWLQLIVFIIMVAINVIAIWYITTDHYIEFKHVNRIKNIAYLVNPKEPKISNLCVKEPAYGSVNKTFKITGKIKRAYLYANLLVKYKIPLTEYDDLYFNVSGSNMNNNKKNFSHIILDDNKIIVPREDSNLYIYNLKKISFRKIDFSGNNNIEYLDDQNLLDLINNNNMISFIVFISSQLKGCVMNEVSIRYECETKSCSITE